MLETRPVTLIVAGASRKSIVWVASRSDSEVEYGPLRHLNGHALGVGAPTVRNPFKWRDDGIIPSVT
jgi:hypothetical protein